MDNTILSAWTDSVDREMKKMSPWGRAIDFTGFITKMGPGENTTPERPIIYGTGSSELEDMAGDRMLESAMADMQKFTPNSAIWLNHQYRVPEDVFGGLAQHPKKGLQAPTANHLSNANRPYQAINIAANVSTINPRAIETYGIISVDEVRLGLSIGCEVSDYDIREDADSLPLGLDIAHVRTLEWSVVGIPCNSESWIQSWSYEAFKGLVENKGKVPEMKSGADLLYATKNFGDFDPLTGLFLRRTKNAPKFAKIVENFDEIKSVYGDEVSDFMQTISGMLNPYGFYIAQI